jgi:hypothetical protein
MPYINFMQVVIETPDYLTDAKALGRTVEPANECLTLTDYRKRYAQYRSDPDSKVFYATLPLIAVWDDHEVANDTYKDGAENHTTATEGSFAARRAAAIQALQHHVHGACFFAAKEQLGRAEQVDVEFRNAVATGRHGGGRRCGIRQDRQKSQWLYRYRCDLDCSQAHERRGQQRRENWHRLVLG